MALVALFAVDAELGAAADLDRPHQAELLIRQGVFRPVVGTVLAKDLGHFEAGPGHGGG
jgi:hypothetical protein